jgi:lysophospholipase L1-like esterase
MNRQKLLPQMIGLMLTVLLLFACGKPQPTPTHTPVPPTVTATSAPEDLTWDYVALGDSIVALPGNYADFYAAHIEADLGVEVRLHNAGVSGQTSTQLLQVLRLTQELRDAISEAEVVTLVIGSNDLNFLLLSSYRGGNCGGEDNRDCLRDALEAFRVNYDAIITELFTLCSSETIIRTMTYHYGSLGLWGFDEDLQPFYGPLNDHIIQASSENDIPVALVHVAFNGPDGDEDPGDKGYLASDGLHTSELGAEVIADLHRELGYEYTCP